MKKPRKQKNSKPAKTIQAGDGGFEITGEASVPYWQHANGKPSTGKSGKRRNFRSQPRSVAKQYWRQ